MFTHNCTKLNAAVHELSCWRRKTNFSTMLKTILLSLLQAVTKSYI